MKKKDLSSSQSYYLKCFMVTQSSGNSQKESRYLFFPPGLSLSRPADTKTDFNLNNIVATLSLISISSVKQIAGKCPDMYSNLISTPFDECQSISNYYGWSSGNLSRSYLSVCCTALSNYFVDSSTCSCQVVGSKGERLICYRSVMRSEL